MKRVVHLIPSDGIGGVEIAARSLPTGDHGPLRFERHYIVRRPDSAMLDGEYHGPETSLNNPLAYLRSIRQFLHNPPNLLVASLWRSALVLIFIKILRPRQRVVIFLHSSHYFHWIDGVVAKFAMLLADEIWADSTATLGRRVMRHLQAKGRVVSFLLEKQTLPMQSDPKPAFIFWGRLNIQKGLDRALGIFAGILRHRPDAHFTIIGPEGGVGKELKALTTKLGIGANVSFSGAMSHRDVINRSSQASFYLQTSRDEGMAMSVVEAMQAGLVPIVTPVGEIFHYCRDGENAVLVHDDQDVIEAVVALMSDSLRYRSMSSAAAEYWQDRPLYRDDFLAAAEKLVWEKSVGN